VWVGSSVPYLSARADGQADAWTEEAAQGGQVGTQRLREVTEVVAPPEVAEALRLPAGSPAVVRRRTMYLDGKAVELTDSWYPSSLASDTALAEPRKIKGGAVTLLAELGYVAHEAREEISFRRASDDECLTLGLPAGEPVIVLFRTVLTSSGIPFEASVMTMVAQGRHLRYRLRVS
jgi:GntR family transcriptional regulator